MDERYIVSGVTNRCLSNDELSELFWTPSESTPSDGGGRLLYDGRNLIAIADEDSRILKQFVDSLRAHPELFSVRVLHRLAINSPELSGFAVSRLDQHVRDTVDQTYLGRLIRSISTEANVNVDTLIDIVIRFLINNQS